jgi:hypothetical protein
MSLRTFCFLLVGGLLVCNAGSSVAAPVPGAADSGGPSKDPEEVKKLLKQRVEVLGKAMTAQQDSFKAGRITLDSIQEVARLLLKAELELASNKAERITAHLNYFKRAREAEMLMTVKYNAGRAGYADYLLATAERLKAEIALRRAGGKPPRE